MVERGGRDAVEAAARNASAGGGLWARAPALRAGVAPCVPGMHGDVVEKMAGTGERRAWSVLRCGDARDDGGARTHARARVLVAHGCAKADHGSTSCKAQAGLEYAAHPKRLGRTPPLSFKFLLVVDDDAYVNTPSLLATLADLDPDEEAVETNGYGCCPFFFRSKSLCGRAWARNKIRWEHVAFAQPLPCPPVTRVVSAMTRATVRALWPALRTRDALVKSNGALHDSKMGMLLWQAHVTVRSRLHGMRSNLPWLQRLHSHRSPELKRLYLPKPTPGRRLSRIPKGDPFAVVHVHFKVHVPRCLDAGDRYIGCATQELRRIFDDEWTWAPPGRARELPAFAWRDDCRTPAGADGRTIPGYEGTTFDMGGLFNATEFHRDFERRRAAAPGGVLAFERWRPNDVDCGAQLNADGSVSWVFKKKHGGGEKTKPRNEYY